MLSRDRVRRASVFTVLAGLLVAAHVGARSLPSDPFAFFGPTIRLSRSDLAKLDRREVLVRVLPADDGHLAVFAAVSLGAPPYALIQWTREIERFKRGPLVQRVGRFSDPPVDADLDALTLDTNDLEALRKCRPGKCDLKLAESEIAAMQTAIRGALQPISQPDGDGWQQAALHAFRRVLLDRVTLHARQGLLALPAYADGARRMSVGEAFSAIVARSPYLTGTVPSIVNALQAPATAAGEGFYYWSRERYGAGRTVVSVTYVRLLQPDEPALPAAMTVSTQLFASHYTEGGVSVTAVLCDAARTACYLAYVNRTQSDVLGGLFGGLKRALIEQRIESDTPTLLRGVRDRLESGREP
jgi:hypothetical protein